MYLRGPLTISQIEEYFQRIFNVRISMLSCGQCCLYNRFIRNP
ncbi:MAG: hypothetical protein JST59_02820 [Actinobacteria bacterium]|nr:hypothetical protein [Actinomycetota bacterium]